MSSTVMVQHCPRPLARALDILSVEPCLAFMNTDISHQEFSRNKHGFLQNKIFFYEDEVLRIYFLNTWIETLPISKLSYIEFYMDIVPIKRKRQF